MFLFLVTCWIEWYCVLYPYYLHKGDFPYWLSVPWAKEEPMAFGNNGYKIYFFKAADQFCRRESELCEVTHCPHVVERWPAAPTCPGWTTQVGGLPSCNPTNSDLRLHVRCWETFNCPNVVRTRRLFASRTFAPRRWKSSGKISLSDTTTIYHTDNIRATENKRRRKKRYWNASLPFTSDYVSSESLSHGRGQKVTICLWVTAVMESGAIFKSRGEEQPWLMCGPCASSFRTIKKKRICSSC